MSLGISGNITRAFIGSALTPLLLLASLVVGLVALISLPREEEPQISVPMVDILVGVNGFKAVDAAELVTKPLEDIVKAVNDVEHVYSQTQDDQVVVTARFKVGTPADAAILRIHERIRANFEQMPIGVREPLIIGRGINDVAVMVLTLTPKPEEKLRWNANKLFELARKLQHELIKTDEVGLTYIIGGEPSEIRVEPDPERLALLGITLNQLVEKIASANRSFKVGNIRHNGKTVGVTAGQTLQGVPDIGLLLLTSRDGRPVYVKDVAKVVVGSEPLEARSWHWRKKDGSLEQTPAVSLAIAKRQGANAVIVTRELQERLATLKQSLIPAGVEIITTRNYGETASEKADELLWHLGIATLSIALLIGLTLGWREGVVVLVVVPVTILLTLFAAWLMGYTINRVSLFALIFSIGILVDDAIVVVENISRHWRLYPAKPKMLSAIEAVAEVGNPTIIATLTIVAALLPMMFVSGLMGPYMSPIPANASAAMLFSFFVAVIITPWLLLKLGSHNHEEKESKMGLLYARLAAPLINDPKKARLFLALVGAATIGVCLLFATKSVTVKLLPFDNKSELNLVVDLPQGASLEDTERVLQMAALRLRDLPELTHLQSYAGTASPFNFNGLVRHYYLRKMPYQGDLQINLTSKHERKRASHEIALDVRKRLEGLELPVNTRLKLVEVPPGPPVMATLIAEIYGPDGETRRAEAEKVKQAFAATGFIVDIDDSFGNPFQRMRIALDNEKLEYHGVEEAVVYDTLNALIGGVKVGYSQRGHETYPLAINIRLPKEDLQCNERISATPIPTRDGRVIELGDVVNISWEAASFPLFRRDGRYIEMVTGELAGRFEAPIYGIFAVEEHLSGIEIKYHGEPLSEAKPTLLWDGEWEITYVTFRDMGAAFGVAILGIYLLVVGQFGSFKLPLVILVPVPLTLIGIIPGHWLFNAPFTATSMIGFIALAGIIVRNSIILVDFIRHLQAQGRPLAEVLLEAGKVRFKPIFLTAAAAITGAAFILSDPIFQGLAISLVFGLFSSTLLTLLVIPSIYIILRK